MRIKIHFEKLRSGQNQTRDITNQVMGFGVQNFSSISG